ncbi:MAG: hypothetical protein P8130_15465 [Deltaproteobacteria bacterium]
MTIIAVALMNISDGICSPVWIMTAGTSSSIIILRASDGHISCRLVIDTAVTGRFVRMAIKAIGRISAGIYGINDLLARAVVAGRAGTGTIGVYVVLNALDFRPISYDMTAAARLAVGQVSGT